MSDFLVLLLAVGGLVAIVRILRRLVMVEQSLRRVESRLAQLEAEGVASPRPPRTAPAAAAIGPAPAVPAPAAPPEVPEPPQPRPAPAPLPRRQQVTLESLIGGWLPIWIGGAALVLAGFFLVRYSIESGLLGPGARTLLAALFGLVLVAGSEAARRLPATRDDPRVAQALAGAGIASLYGTLYMAAALYHLIAPLPAFLVLAAITGLAMAMSLRHGPPTAIMALVGGFAAPMVAGFDAVGVAPLLVYLALVVAAMFALAVHRGWAWLAIAAAVMGFAWINYLTVMLQGREGALSAVGGFTLLLAAAASGALPATGARNPWLRIVPLVAGLAQLVVLAPSLHFDALSWSFYLLLAGAALFLAARDNRYLPGALAALVLLLVLEALALLQPERSVTPVAALIATLLFSTPAQALPQRRGLWPFLEVGGAAGPLLVAQACAPSLLDPALWGLLDLLATAACAWSAWRLREDREAPALLAATALTALLAALAFARFLPDAWLSLPLAALILALAAWARHTQAPRLFGLPALPYVAALAAAGLPLLALFELVFAAAAGDRLPYLRLPHLDLLLRTLALPTVALLAILFDPRQLGRARRIVATVASVVGLLLLYAIAKQPLAIATLPRFAELGFFERALITQACLAAGWWLTRTKRLPNLAIMLLMLGLARILWFDLLVLNPAVEPQSVGPLPIANAAVLHLGLAAFWLWTLPTARPARIAAALLTLATALAAVRQATHGSLMTGPVSTLENGGYSAALLGVAIFWLWRGIQAAQRDLRIAGLGLLTLVTFKVFLIDAAALDGVLRILSFLGLGIALIGIGWAYTRFLGRSSEEPVPPPAAA